MAALQEAHCLFKQLGDRPNRVSSDRPALWSLRVCAGLHHSEDQRSASSQHRLQWASAGGADVRHSPPHLLLCCVCAKHAPCLCRNVEFHPLLFRQHEKAPVKELECFDRVSSVATRVECITPAPLPPLPPVRLWTSSSPPRAVRSRTSRRSTWWVVLFCSDCSAWYILTQKLCETDTVRNLIKTPFYTSSPWCLISAKKHITGKSSSRGTKWCKFQFHSTFRFGVKGPQRMSSFSVKTPYYSPWFLARI